MRRLLCWLGWHETPRSLPMRGEGEWGHLMKWRCVHCRKPWMEW